MKSSRIIVLASCLGLLAPLAAHAADTSSQEPGKHDTAKGAAAGALIGHEVGSGHAVAGATAGAMVGHHEKTKAENGG